MERERERSLGRDGSLGRHCDLRGAELVQVAERQLSQIQHVHGYVTHTHITPAQVTSSGFIPCCSGAPSVRIQTHTCDVHIFLTLPGCSRNTHTRWAQGEAGVWSLFTVCLSVHVKTTPLTNAGHLVPDVPSSCRALKRLAEFCFDSELMNFVVYSYQMIHHHLCVFLSFMCS